MWHHLETAPETEAGLMRSAATTGFLFTIRRKYVDEFHVHGDSIQPVTIGVHKSVHVMVDFTMHLVDGAIDEKTGDNRVRYADTAKAENLLQSKGDAIKSAAETVLIVAVEQVRAEVAVFANDPWFAREQARWREFAAPQILEAVVEYERAKRATVAAALQNYTWNLSGTRLHEYQSTSTASLGNLQTRAAAAEKNVDVLKNTIRAVAGHFVRSDVLHHEALMAIRDEDFDAAMIAAYDAVRNVKSPNYTQR